MCFVIGCSGSTGSSLLKTILNRHSQIFAGPETSLFAFPQVYDRWNHLNNKLHKGIITDGWSIKNGMDLLQEDIGWTATALNQVTQAAESFPDFVNRFFGLPLKKYQKQYWLEKTPINAYGAAAFLEHFPEGKVIQIIRNPYDTVASLVSRNINPYWATGYYVYNTAIMSSVHHSPSYYQLTYEDLVEKPHYTLESLFHFMDLPFEQEIIEARHEKRKEPTTIRGWKHHETGSIQSSSIGRFGELPPPQQELIKSALTHFEIQANYLDKYQIQFKNAAELCQHFDYPFLQSSITPKSLKKYYWKDRFSRIKRGKSQQFFNYPGGI